MLCSRQQDHGRLVAECLGWRDTGFNLYAAPAISDWLSHSISVRPSPNARCAMLLAEFAKCCINNCVWGGGGGGFGLALRGHQRHMAACPPMMMNWCDRLCVSVCFRHFIHCFYIHIFISRLIGFKAECRTDFYVIYSCPFSVARTIDEQIDEFRPHAPRRNAGKVYINIVCINYS